jgi:hypothetical protein
MNDDTLDDVPPSPRDDLNSRIERRLWVLQHGTDRAEARMCAKFGRREFRVYVNGGLLWSRNYALDETQRFDDDAAAKFAELVALGWEDPDGASRGE